MTDDFLFKGPKRPSGNAFIDLPPPWWFIGLMVIILVSLLAVCGAGLAWAFFSLLS